MRHQSRNLGILQVMFAGFCFGFLGVLGKWAYSLGLTTGEFLSLRFLTASFLLGIFLAARSPGLLKIGTTATWRAAVLGIFGYALFSSCYFMALRGLSVSLTVLLLYTYPVWVTLGARIFFHEKLSLLQWAALPLVLLGLVLLLWGELQVRDTLSLWLGVFSAVFYSAYILASRNWMRTVPALGSSFYVMLAAGVTLGSIHLRSLPSTTEMWLAVLATAVVGTVLPITLFLAGLQKLSGAETSMLSMAEPCTAVLMGFVFFQESLSLVQAIGAILIVGGMIAVAISPKAS